MIADNYYQVISGLVVSAPNHSACSSDWKYEIIYFQ
ncbi:hypothetical protein Belba_2796 [Belliella baltica DSM 15883]|uniref:Uncharacterized protein n=1 Tax=Belliella baltica (strain DSM 15883 / CIP 108006 / LMG 21964 / BA134) TaxID=866536 RepID=I3Z7W3_BELBD|nr:hypothetical protein Belba_2796 [Belliella baltica DSM 15883]